MSGETISIAVIDGNYQYLRNVREYAGLKSEVERCDTFSTAREFLVALQTGCTYEVTVLSDFLPDTHTEKFLRQFRELNLPAKPALLLTLLSPDWNRQELLKTLGADRVIQRPSSLTDLMDSVLALAMDTELYLRNRTREQIWWAIREVGIPSGDAAYKYLFIAMEYSLKAGVGCAPTKELYSYIKKECNVSGYAAESALRRLAERYIPKDGAIYRELCEELKLRPEENLSATRLVSALVQRVIPRIGQYGKDLLKEA